MAEEKPGHSRRAFHLGAEAAKVSLPDFRRSRQAALGPKALHVEAQTNRQLAGALDNPLLTGDVMFPVPKASGFAECLRDISDVLKVIGAADAT
jgi:hypothetical protein